MLIADGAVAVVVGAACTVISPVSIRPQPASRRPSMIAKVRYTCQRWIVPDEYLFDFIVILYFLVRV